MEYRDIVLSVDVVEPGLVNAVKLLSKKLDRELKGICLVHKDFLDYPGRPVDSTGLFEEIAVNFDNQDELQKAILPFMDRVLVATTRYEDAIHHLSQLVPFLPYVNTPTESSLIWSTEKPLMRAKLKNYDESLVPKYVNIKRSNLSNWKDLIKQLTYPVIVKPGSLWSSFLVSRCDNESELKDCLYNTFKMIDTVYDRLRRESEPEVLIEEMIQGDMYSTDVYVSQDGTIRCLPLVKVITAASLGLPGFAGHSFIVPTELSNIDTENGISAAKAAVRALHLRSTTVHVELFHTTQGWKVIELGARIGGTREELYREAFEIEHHYNDLANRAGLEPDMPNKLVRYVRGEDIYADKEGIIEAVEGIDEARKLASMAYMNVNVKPGDKSLFADKGGDVLIETILSNADKKILESDAVKLRTLINFKVKAV